MKTLEIFYVESMFLSDKTKMIYKSIYIVENGNKYTSFCIFPIYFEKHSLSVIISALEAWISIKYRMNLITILQIRTLCIGGSWFLDFFFFLDYSLLT